MKDSQRNDFTLLNNCEIFKKMEYSILKSLIIGFQVFYSIVGKKNISSSELLEYI